MQPVFTSLAEEVEEKKNNGFDAGEEDTFYTYPNYPQTSRYLKMMDGYLDYIDVEEPQEGLAFTPDGYTMHGIGVRTGLADDYGDDSWYPEVQGQPALANANANASTTANVLPSFPVVSTGVKKSMDATIDKVAKTVSGIVTVRAFQWGLLQPYILAGVLTIVLLSGNETARQNTHNQWGRIFGLAVIDIVPTVLYGLAVWYWWFDKKISAWLSIGLTFGAGIVVHALLKLPTPLNQMLGLA